MRFILSVLLVSAMTSCAFFRYHSSVVDKPSRKINHVAVLIYTDQYPTENLTHEFRFQAVRAVAEGLKGLDAFDFMILEKQEPLFRVVNMQGSAFLSELAQNYDAYILVITKTGLTHKVTIELRQTNSAATLLIEARHSIYGDDLEEAVQQTMDLFGKEWKKIE
jgi:hypothetical protein